MAATNEITIGIIIAINGLVLIGAGLLLHRVAGMLVRGEISRKNYMGIGFKIKEAFASDEAWYRINREGGKLMITQTKVLVTIGVLMVLFGVVVALFGFELRFMTLIPIVTLAAIFLVLLVPSCWYVIRVKRDERKRKAD